LHRERIEQRAQPSDLLLSTAQTVFNHAARRLAATGQTSSYVGFRDVCALDVPVSRLDPRQRFLKPTFI
jgi:hypothetical protein